MDEVGLHDAYDLAGSRVSGNQGIQGLWFTAERDDDASSRPAHFSREDEQFFFYAFLLGRSRGTVAGEHGKEKKQTRENPAPKGHCSSVFHVSFPRLLLSILYASPRPCNELANPKYPRKNGTIARAGKYIHQ